MLPAERFLPPTLPLIKKSVSGDGESGYDGDDFS